MADIWVDTSCTYNGDGSLPTCASADGEAGAYNNLADALAAAVAGDTIWVRRNVINVTATLSPTNAGTATSPIRLIGWSFYRQETGTVQEAVTGKEKWAFKTTSLTDTDLNYWVAAVVEFTDSNDPNYGQKRKVIWYEYDSDNNVATVYLDFDLPNNIGTYSFTITLKTEEYDNRPQAGIDAGWDNDGLVRPVLDGGGNSIDLLYFGGDLFWYTYNLELKNITQETGSSLIYGYGSRVWNCVLHDGQGFLGLSNTNREGSHVKDVYIWNSGGYAAVTLSYGRPILLLEDVHINGFIGGGDAVGLQPIYDTNVIRLKNVTFGKVHQLTYDIKLRYDGMPRIDGENVILSDSTPVYISSKVRAYHVRLSSYNGEPNKFHQWVFSGEIYNVDKDALIDPPSGATTYVKLVSNANCCKDYPLKLEFSRKQAAGSKTYTFKIMPVGWTSLTTDDVYVKAWYLDDAGSHRSELISHPESVTNDTWNDISFSLTTEQDGTVYFELCLAKYESGCYIAFDPKFDVS